MEFSDNGALSQAFVLEALTRYVKKVIEEKDALILEEKENATRGKFAFISMVGWVRTAEEIEKKLKVQGY
jgi:hypothetical protein